MNWKLLRKKNVQFYKCPNCSEIATLKRSRSRNIYEKFLKHLKISIFFCESCGWRGKIFTYKLSSNFLQIIIIYFIVIIITSFLVNKFLKNYFD